MPKVLGGAFPSPGWTPGARNFTSSRRPYGAGAAAVPRLAGDVVGPVAETVVVVPDGDERWGPDQPERAGPAVRQRRGDGVEEGFEYVNSTWPH